LIPEDMLFVTQLLGVCLAYAMQQKR